MAKQVIHGEDSRQAILRGVNQLADAVAIALMLTTEALVSEITEEKKAIAAPSGGIGEF